MFEVGTRWFYNGRHYTVLDRKERATVLGHGMSILLVPDESPGKPSKPKPIHWLNEERAKMLVRTARITESG